MKNTLIDFELTNGEIVKLTLTFGKLNLLKSVNNALYQKYNSILYGKSEDILDMVTMIYVAYFCANYGKDNFHSEQEFIELVPFNMNEIKRVTIQLTSPKKK